jgi:hypothetical protein
MQQPESTLPVDRTHYQLMCAGEHAVKRKLNRSFSMTRCWSSRMLATVFASSGCKLLAAQMPGDCFTSASRYAVLAG